MKITAPSKARCQSGSVVLIFTILLTIMVILVTAEMRSLAQLQRQEKFLEQQQIKRLEQSQSPSPTNITAAAVMLTISK
jgi:hypothetical protein